MKIGSFFFSLSILIIKILNDIFNETGTLYAKEHFSVWNNFICYSCHKVINNRTYQIARMRSLIWAFLQFL